MSDTKDEVSTYTVLVTGANSGLGFSTCCRLIDEFLHSRPQSQTLHLIITTRSASKNADTQTRLQQHLQKTLHAANAKTLGISAILEKRIRIEGEQVDLCNLLSVRAVAKRLTSRGDSLDVLVLNAGIGGWKGLNWPKAIWGITTDLRHACTYPSYKLGIVGSVTPAQLTQTTGEQKPKQKQKQKQEKEPKLGEVFTANVFGHYMLAHWLAPLMKGQASKEPGRIIWVSSIEAYSHAFNVSDLQGLETDASYESSKRLTDLLVLTSTLPSTKPWTRKYLGEEETAPNMYLGHPGICATSIADLPAVLFYCMVFAQYVARWLGSPWHPVSPYLGAVSSVWLALAPLSWLSQQESSNGKAKWASSTDVFGNERVVRTEVEGWGWGGKVGEKADGAMRLENNRWRGLKTVTDESREEFEAVGREVWKEMEALREEWEERLNHIDG